MTAAAGLRRGVLAIAACIAVLDGAMAAPAPDAIHATLRRALEQFQMPGMAVTVVHGDDIIVAGHGVLEHGREAPVDADTLFQIGSVSKAFTAAALALLVDEGKLGWDDPVIDHLPEFRMYDPWVTREFTVRDLLTHRSGLPLGAGDLLIFPEGTATRAEIIRALRFLKPTSSFRAKYDYDNLLYIVAGEVVARVSGKAFEDFLEQRLLKPLGMEDCTASASRAPAGSRRATPHVLVDGELRTASAGIQDVVSAAGGVTCNARGMARWMAMLLNRGRRSDGTPLISEQQFAHLVGPVTLLPSSPYMVEHAGAHLNAYALGWNVSTFYGQLVWSHGGAVWGMTSFLMVLPQQGIALFAAGNQMSPAPRAVVNALADHLLDGLVPGTGKDWIAILGAVSAGRRADAVSAVAAAEAARDRNSRPSLPLEAYVGTYRDPWYGTIRISREKDGRLWFRSDRNAPLAGPLEHFHHDTFIARWTDRRLMADAYVSFSLSPEGLIERIRMKAVSPATDFSYDFHDLDLERVK
jgi:CubicO group peptidase (beta-lactamase class C family)